MTGNQITAEELNDKLKAGLTSEEIIIDVRTTGECTKGMIPGAKNIPVNDIMARKNELENYKNIYLYCLSGSRSELALIQLQSAGLKANIFSLTSGLLAWRAGGFPMSESNA
jgi:rhodanese-related sulfurtransferase